MNSVVFNSDLLIAPNGYVYETLGIAGFVTAETNANTGQNIYVIN